MHRTQIQLEQWQYERLVRKADSDGTSIAHLIRTAVTEYLERPRGSGAGAGLSRIAGIGDDAGAAGRDHDHLLYGDRSRENSGPGGDGA